MSNDETNIKEGKWNNVAHSALCAALAEALIAAGSGAAQQKDLILSVMKSKGLESFTWESIRLYEAFHPTLTEELKESVAEAMRSRGHQDIGWSAVR
ncbi:hypothetical protein B0T20DRAFT_482761 [Sordaria brevicollis]|uniref:Uncharacterized protein n=1 Tax=Sordaria brevicollis TaxID=83679 RepID=A0AAE0P3Q4_SORBR|nr:hypothetical protein B0T20DRAFT_482761 [Sordaria brevicollis]